jgi:hypothetical protein
MKTIIVAKNEKAEAKFSKAYPSAKPTANKCLTRNIQTNEWKLYTEYNISDTDYDRMTEDSKNNKII